MDCGSSLGDVYSWHSYSAPILVCKSTKMEVIPRRWLFLCVCSHTLGIGDTVAMGTAVILRLILGDFISVPLTFVAKPMSIFTG